MKSKFNWYTLQVSASQEEKAAKDILTHIEALNLSHKITDVKVLKSYEIQESEAYSPNSPDLPTKSFRNTKRSRWIKLNNGYYKKVRIVEKKPFSGLIFLRIDTSGENLDSSNNIFRKVKSWISISNFLPSIKNPAPTSDEKFAVFSEMFSGIVPDLDLYIAENISNYKPESIKQYLKDSMGIADDEDDFMADFQILSEDEMEQKFADSESKSVTDLDEDFLEQDSSLNSTSNQQPVVEVTKTPVVSKPEPKPVEVVKPKPKPVEPQVEIDFVVGEEVLYNDLNEKVKVLSINPEKYKVTISYDFFGREQVAEVDPSSLKKLS